VTISSFYNILKFFIKKNIPAWITPVKYNRAAIYTLISDDGEISTVMKLSELATFFDIRITIASTIKNIENHKNVYNSILSEGRKGAVEVISHTWDHYCFKNSNEECSQIYKRQIGDSVRYLEKWLNTKQICFVCPNNYADERVYENLWKNGIIAVRRWKRGENTTSPAYGCEFGEWLNLRTRGIGDVENTQERNSWIDNVVANKNWLIEMWHNIDVPGYQTISFDEAKAHLEYIKNKSCKNELWVAGFEEATKYIIEKQNLELIAKKIYNLIIVIGKLNKDYSEKIFNEEITAKIELPENWEDVTGYVSYKKITTKDIFKDGKTYVIFEMKPNEVIVLRRCKSKEKMIK